MPVLTCLLLQIIEDLMSVFLAVLAAGDVWFDSFDKLRNQHTNREQFLEVANMRDMKEHCGGKS